MGQRLISPSSCALIILGEDKVVVVVFLRFGAIDLCLCDGLAPLVKPSLFLAGQGPSKRFQGPSVIDLILLHGDILGPIGCC